MDPVYIILCHSHYTPHAIVHVYYFGHGRKDTGDWCFLDGKITFSDIVELYKQHLSGRVLTIVTDCSHSGAWVNACLGHLEASGVQPCGHSAKDRGILLKVYASCRPKESAAARCFFVRGFENDPKNGGVFCYTDVEISESQHCFGVNTTEITCNKKSIEEMCILQPQSTWMKWREMKRLQLIKSTYCGHAIWRYVLFDDDPEKMKNYYQKKAAADETEIVNLRDYGKIIRSGWGDEPPQDVKEEMDRMYSLY